MQGLGGGANAMILRLLVNKSRIYRMQRWAMPPRQASTCRSQHGSQTLIEKIVQSCALSSPRGAPITTPVHQGDFIYLRPSHVMTHDNTAAVMSKFRAWGCTAIANPRQPVFTLDHNVQDRSGRTRAMHAAIEAFSREQGVDFFPAGRGIGHQVMCEEGYVQPGRVVVASDSHSNTCGALSSLGTPVTRTDAAALWATGVTWWEVPPVSLVVLEGGLSEGATGKDVILALCGAFGGGEVRNHALEFTGPGVASLGMEERMTVSNMTTEWGALAGVFPSDDVTMEWLRSRGIFKGGQVEEGALRGLKADPGARYVRELRMDLSSVGPLVAGPHHVNKVRSVREVERERVAVHKAYLVSCVNSRVGDIAAAAQVLRGKKVAPSVELYIAAASSEVERECRRLGHWQALVNAGAQELPSGCGPCVGLGRGLLREGEVAISATNRNFQGRMGSPKSHTYLASPAVVAHSALVGYISAPPSSTPDSPSGPLVCHATVLDQDRGSSRPRVRGEPMVVVEGFPSGMEGRMVLCPRDSIDTDGIYAGRHCYEDLGPKQQAAVVMENYDPSFAGVVCHGDVLVAGHDFGCGSSREQAATSIKACGVQLVVAASANQTYKRNALNHGLLVLEVPALVQALRERYGAGTEDGCRTLVVEARLKVDFRRSVVEWVRPATSSSSFAFAPLGRVAQELIVAGGLEGWIRNMEGRC